MTRIATPISEIKEHYDVIVIGSGYGGGIAASRCPGPASRCACLNAGGKFSPVNTPTP
jgi:cholesterol oxidase